jgi:protein involved in sex pheromone biosynthesis
LAYDATKTWENYDKEVQNHSRAIIEQLTRGEEFYKDLLIFKDGRSNAVIATALGVDVSFIDDLSAAVTAMHKMFQVLENSATVAQQDFGNNMRKFT